MSTGTGTSPLTPRGKAAILGLAGGAIAGAMLFRSHGWLAELAGAVSAGIVGFIIAPAIALAILLCFLFVRILGRIYWEVLTGRRKLPSVKDGTMAHRKRILKLLAAIFIASGAIWVGLYFRAPDAERPRVLRLAGFMFGACLIPMMALLAIWRRHPARKDTSLSPQQATPGKDLQEFSANFDSEMVRPFLERIQRFIVSGFGPDEIDQVCQLVGTLGHDNERNLEFEIRHGDNEAKLEIRVFMDDIDAPDVYFFAPPALKEQIKSEFGRFAEERGI